MSTNTEPTADATDEPTVETLLRAVEDLKETVEAQAERIDDLEQSLADHKQHTGRVAADIRRRVSDLEDRVEAVEDAESPESPAAEGGSDGSSPTPEGGETGSPADLTPLDRVVALAEHTAERELTANQKRARFIARDVRDYAEKAPAGLVVDSRTIKKVVTAAEGSKPHTQTVARIIDFLADMGKGDVEQTKRRGKKLVVFEPPAADRLANHERCDRDVADSPTAGVIGST